jgi:CheY-like chemotaxis protein
LVASYRELNKINKQLTRVSNLKSQFVSTISHELRTPLYGVVGISDILVAEYPALKNSTYINSLKFSANYLLSLVNDVLEISKIENKNIVLEDITFNIFEEMNSILGTINVLFKINHTTVEFDIDENIPKQLIGDKNRLSQILINLLGNSLKFTKEGKVTLTLRVIKKNADSSVIEFEVKDTGVGIAFENQTKIFEKFVQLNESNDMYQGSGLGLSIVQKLINLFNSKILLQSELGKGTQFNFSIEFKNGTVEDSKLLDYEVSYDLFSGYKVLIVEDNKINQFVTKKLLEKINFECHIVESGFDALEILKNQNFDLILMDINMPGWNGFETTIKIRQSNITTPIVALTAFSKLEVEKESIDSGMNAVVIKPYEFSELYSIISYLVNKKNAD